MLTGITSNRADELLKQYGENSIISQNKRTFVQKFFEQFNNFLTLLLIGAALLSYLIGEPVDGTLILTIVVLNAFFGLYQEAKAEESIAALKQMTVSKVRVIRDGIEKEIDSKYLVPGDMVFIEEGIKVPADGKILEGRNLELNESALTGESLPVPKAPDDPVYMGTIIAKGRGYILVGKTGMSTKFGEIAAKLSLIDDSQTPLQKKLSSLTRMIGIVGIIIAGVVFFLSFLNGSGYFPAFLLAISLAVAVVPEGLPAVMTITLAIGVKEMAKKKAIIRKLSAVEGLGSVTLIATDKTGTLTTNKMKVKEVWTDNKLYFDADFKNIKSTAFDNILLNGVLCGTASLVYVHDHGSWDVLGDPTEGALLYLAKSVEMDIDAIKKSWDIVDEHPFDSVSKRMSVLVNKDNERMIFTKGAPESLLDICSKILINNREIVFDEKEKAKIKRQVEEWGSRGLRVLGFGYKKHTGLLPTDLTDLVFLGLTAIHDAPRPEAVEAVKKAHMAGIQVVMITGDNEKTAEAIATHVGIMTEGGEILTGAQIESYTDEELLKVMPRVCVFARTSPFHKHRIVELYQKTGEIVAVTGDGVNDAIALKQADVGVAMGLVGTDVARETADMVITDDNFATIINAVEEGRNIIKNLRNSITYLLSCNLSEAISLVVGIIMGFPHIFYPIQFLYINLVTDGFPALSLAFSPRNHELMQQHPVKRDALIGRYDRKYIVMVGVITSIITLSSFYIFLKAGDNLLAKTAAFSVLTLSQSFIFVDLWLSHMSLRHHWKKLLSPLFFLAFGFPFLAQFIILKFNGIATLFKVTSVPFATYLQFCFLSFIVLIGIKGAKLLIKR